LLLSEAARELIEHRAFPGRLAALELLDLRETFQVLPNQARNALQTVFGVLAQHLRSERVTQLAEIIKPTHGAPLIQRGGI